MMNKANLSNEKPPIFPKIQEVFPYADWEEVIIAYGDTIYSKYPISLLKMEHELTHVRQQTDMDKDLWWDQYLQNPSFRLEQEIEAYRAETKLACKVIKDKNQRFNYINALAEDLSSPLYGNVCTFSQALSLLK